MKPLKLLVVIVTYNGRRWLDRCLGSVRTWKPDGSALSAVDLFVVDNASTDGSADFVASEFPEAILVRNDRNLGFGKANNIGMRYALEKGYTNIYGTDVNITSRNTVDINNNVLLDNSKYYQIKNSSGSAWNAVTLNNSNQYTFGNGGYSASTGESFFDGNWVRIRTKNKVTINGKAPFKYTTNSVAIGNVSAGSGWTKNKQATAQSGYTAVGIIGFNQTHNQAGSVGGCLINVSNRTCYAYGSNWGGNWTGTNNFQWDILWIANELL